MSSSDEARKIFVILNFSSHADPFIARCLLSRWGKTGELQFTKESALLAFSSTGREETIRNKVQIFIYKKHIYMHREDTSVSPRDRLPLSDYVESKVQKISFLF